MVALKENTQMNNRTVVFYSIFRRDLSLALRGGASNFVPVIFFIIAVVLFPLGLGSEQETLSRIAPAIVLVCALLAMMLSLDSLFREDYDDGNLEQISLGFLPLEFVVLAKALAHWVTAGLPLIICSPLLALTLNISIKALVTLIFTLLLATPTLTLIGTVGASLTVSLRRGGLLTSLLVLPISIPVLIFASSAVEASILNLNTNTHLILLSGGLITALVLAPIAAAAALKISLE
tara:strand:+ start:41349 stop:42053 length:705 start_codon:yes stop_codon:yes gene_type:complete